MQRSNAIKEEITNKWLPIPKMDKEVTIGYTKDGRLSKVCLNGISNALHTVRGDFSRIKYVPFNLSSRQQISDRLMRLGWKPTKFTEKGQAIVDESVLSKLDYPEAKLLSEYFIKGTEAVIKVFGAALRIESNSGQSLTNIMSISASSAAAAS